MNLPYNFIEIIPKFAPLISLILSNSSEQQSDEDQNNHGESQNGGVGAVDKALIVLSGGRIRDGVSKSLSAVDSTGGQGVAIGDDVTTGIGSASKNASSVSDIITAIGDCRSGDGSAIGCA